MEIDIWIKVLVGIMLCICGIKDMRTKTVPLYIIGITAVLLCIALPFAGKMVIIDIIGGIFPGLLLLIVSKVSRGQIGMGDGIVFCVTGIGLGLWLNIWLLMYSLLLAAVFGLLLMIVKRAGKRRAIPFMPFVFIAYIGVIVLC